MRFGDLPGWATELSRLVREAVWFGDLSCASDGESSLGLQYGEDRWPLPLDLLWREPLFDQLIANVYNPGEVRPSVHNPLKLYGGLLPLHYLVYCRAQI